MKGNTSISESVKERSASSSLKETRDRTNTEPHYILSEILSEALFEILQTKPGLTHLKHSKRKQKTPK